MPKRLPLLLFLLLLGFLPAARRAATEAAQPAPAALRLPFVTGTPGIALEPFTGGLPNVTDLQHAGDDRLFAAIRDGRIFAITGDGRLDPTPFLDIRDRVETAYWEQGLLGLAFHPDYANNGYVYVYYSARVAAGVAPAVLARFTADPAGGPVDPATEFRLLTLDHDDGLHYGGALHFGPDGYLYVASGDGAFRQPPDVTPNAQNGDNLLGKILRLDVDGGEPYAVPADNPFAGDDPRRDEIWVMGLRNPWRFSFDPLTGDMYIADVGEAKREEVNFVAAGDSGHNFGWPCFEGRDPRPATPGCGPAEEYDFPIYLYHHSGETCSITGGYVYRGRAVPHLTGRYLYTDFCSGQLWALYRVGDQARVTRLASFPDHRWTTFGVDRHGELYLGSFSAADPIFRITLPR